MWGKRSDRKAKEAARKEQLEQAIKSQETLQDAAKSTMGLASDVAGTLQAKIDDYANQLDLTARLLSDALLTVDQNGIIKTYNKAAEEMFGWSKKEVHGWSISKLFELEPATIDLAYMQEFTTRVNEDRIGVGTVYYEEFKGIVKSGAHIYVDVSASELTQGGNKTLFLVLVRDVSHRVENAKMVEKLADKNQELISAINSSDSGIVILEPDEHGFKTMFVNKGFENMLNCPRSTLLEERILDMLADDGGQFEVRRLLSAHISGRADVRLLSKCGRELNADVSITPLNKGGKVYQWVLAFYDTTELIRATQELARSEAHFRAFAETSTEVLIVHNGERILDWNSRLRNLSGYSDSEIAKLSPYDLVHPLERNNTRDVVLLNGVSQYETLNVTKSGEVLWVAISSRPIEWDGQDARIAVMRDITPYRTVENQLSTMRERYQSVVDNTIDLVCCFDKNFKVTFTNQTFRDYFNLDIEDLDGFSLLEVIPEADHLKFIDYMHSITQDTPVRRGVHRVDRGGDLRWQDWIDKGVFDETGELIEFQSVCRDVTHLFPQK
jgi:PAS domain S-box-containing protein